MHKQVFKIFNNLEIGIGEVSKLTGVSQRQLRYWEQKGYIKPVNNDSGVRVYTLMTLYNIIYIKAKLDDGFTLKAAYEKSKKSYTKGKIIRKFFSGLITGVEVEDNEKDYGKILFGDAAHVDGEDYELSGIVDEHGNHFEIKKRSNH